MDTNDRLVEASATEFVDAVELAAFQTLASRRPDYGTIDVYRAIEKEKSVVRILQGRGAGR